MAAPTLRVATPDAAAAIAPFHLECWRRAYADVVPRAFVDALAQQDRVAAWRRRLTRPGDVTTLAVDGDAVVGLATVGPIDHPPGVELRSLYVRHTHHGRGLGRRLVAESLAGRAASLWVFERNHRARGFYAATGWDPTGERRLDEGIGADVWELRMRRPAADTVRATG